MQDQASTTASTDGEDLLSGGVSAQEPQNDPTSDSPTGEAGGESALAAPQGPFDQEASVSPLDVGDALPERINPVPDAPEIGGLLPGEDGYPYDDVISGLGREAGTVRRHALHLERTSAALAAVKARTNQRLTLAELNRRNQEVSRKLDDHRHQVRGAIMEMVTESGILGKNG